MSAPPPPMPPRPPGMVKSIPPLPPGFAAMPAVPPGAHPASARPIPPMPPHMARPEPAGVPAVDRSRYLAPPPSSYAYADRAHTGHPSGPSVTSYHGYPPPSSINNNNNRPYPTPPLPSSAATAAHYDDNDDYHHHTAVRGRAGEAVYRPPSHPEPRGYPAVQHARPYPHPAESAASASRYAPYDSAAAPYYYGNAAPGGGGGHYAAHPSYEEGYAGCYSSSSGVPPPHAMEGGGSKETARAHGGGGGGASRRRGYAGQEEVSVPLREATNTVWVGNLDLAVHTDEALRNVMHEFGLVMRVARQAEKTYCFVHFRHVEEARRAVTTLTQRGTLGQVKFNYGKMFEYTPEEMSREYDPDVRVCYASTNASRRRGNNNNNNSSSNGDAAQDGGDDDESRSRRPTRRGRAEREPMEPSNVLWVGSLPPSVTDDTLRDVFEVFGTITHISRMDKGGMAFVYFDTEEHCTLALQTMSGRPIDGGVVLALNYGHAQRNASSAGGGGGSGAAGGGSGGSEQVDADGIHVNEVPTNVVYLGQLPSDIEDSDVEALFEPYEGFINSKHISSGNIGFGHFDSIEHARAARIGLNHTTLKGTPIRVNFGKNNHSINLPTAAARKAAAERGGGFNLDDMMRDPAEGDGAHPSSGSMALMRMQDGSSGGALIAGGAGSYRMDGASAAGTVMLPAMGGGGGAHAEKDVFTRERAAPKLTLDVHLNTLLGSTYNELGARDLEMSPSQIQAICSMVDHTIDEASAQRLDDAVSLYTPLKCVHVFNVVAKRTREYFIDDPHKKMLILYAVTRALLGADTRFVSFNSAGLNAYLVNLVVASEGQTSSGADRLCSIVESLKQSDFIAKKAQVEDDYVEEFRSHLDDVVYRVKAEQDLSTFLTRKRRR